MSVSTRTAQQPLGFGQLGTALIVIALALVVAAAVAFGSMAAKPAAIPAPGVGAPPAVIDHGSRGEMNALPKRDLTQNWGSYVSDGRPTYLGNDVLGNAAGNDARHYRVPGQRAQ